MRVPAAAGTHLIRAVGVVGEPGGPTRRTATATYGLAGKGPVVESVSDEERDRIVRCGNDTNRVWLTFDDGFLRKPTMDAMLATLERENVKARFFATGQWARGHPSWVETLRRAGHLVGNHTSTHEWLNELDDDRLRTQIARGADASEPRLLRPGFGGGAFSATVNRVATSLGHQVCLWSVDTRDWDGRAAPQVISSAVNGNEITPPVRPGGVVLMHMTGKHTAEALPGLIAAIRDRGMQLEPLR